jgi:hypothetical protein
MSFIFDSFTLSLVRTLYCSVARWPMMKKVTRMSKECVVVWFLLLSRGWVESRKPAGLRSCIWICDRPNTEFEWQILSIQVSTQDFCANFIALYKCPFGVCFVWFCIKQLLTVCRDFGQVCIQHSIDFQIYGFYNLLVSVVINNTDEINI